MKKMCLVLAGAIALLAVSPVFAQNVKIQPLPGQPSTGIGIGVPGATPLMTPDAVEKLKFTAEQKDKYAKIETDYKDKAKGAQDTFRNAVKNLGDREKYKEVVEKFQTESKKVREDALAKVEPILTTEQKTVFAVVKTQQPLPGGIRPVPPIAIGGQGIGQVLPPVVQQRLKLTDEQKKQIEEIQKEVEVKVMKVLTDEQKKQIEDMKKGPIIRPNPLPVRPIQIQPRNPAVLPVNPAGKD